MDKQLEKFAKIPVVFKLVAVVIIVVAMIAGDYLLFVAQTQGQMEDLRNTIDSKASELSKLKSQAADRATYERQIQKLQQQLAAAEEQLPKKAEIPRLLRDMAYEAQQSGLTLKRFELIGERVKGDFAHVPVQMDVFGGYHEIAVFLDRLAKMPRIINATSLKLEDPKFENKNIVLTSSFRATTYRYLDKAERAKKKGGKKKRRRGKKR